MTVSLRQQVPRNATLGFGRFWPFLDPPSTAVFTNVRILDGELWVQYVTHDDEDGAWQFHPPGGRADMHEASLTSLKQTLALEPRIEELADLPLGWHVWRDEKDAAWTRAPKEQG